MWFHNGKSKSYGAFPEDLRPVLIKYGKSFSYTFLNKFSESLKSASIWFSFSQKLCKLMISKSLFLENIHIPEAKILQISHDIFFVDFWAQGVRFKTL